MRARKSIVAATVLATTLASLWVGSASASCTLCFDDPISGKKVCFENMCAYLKPWLPVPPDAHIKSPVDISSFARELQSAVADPEPLPWVLINPSTQRQFILDLQKGTMTEVVAGQGH